MKALILAAGYGTRLAQELQSDKSGEFTHLIDLPKPLLPVGKQPLISHWMDNLKNYEEIDATYVVVNNRNIDAFQEWAVDWPHVQLFSDGSISNETRGGAVGCIDKAVKHFKIEDDLLIIAGDTLFYEDFKFDEFLQTFYSYQKTDVSSSLLVYVTCTEKEVTKRGIIETDSNGRVKAFLEKPQPSQTISRKSVPAFYLISKACLFLLLEFLELNKDEPIAKRDAPGHFIAHLASRKPVFAVEISGRFDVGGLQSYLACHKHFSSASDNST